ncbi:Gfo/Idh/MocA family oxidoreductase [Ferruginibacter sp.]|uniref:Gfo/Idh/MocA family oxidoreductase n=1 Tax=Ferruginibacter sp. TaxID=1940288 RepID=UPI002659849D|nr:Gfo/Idh/MocA family oxidoreductase [Ferruginibacter sp.]
MRIIKTALLSYGMSGKIFHAPFIAAHPGFKLCGAWERSNKNIQQDYPHATSYATLEALLADETIELVIVNTPNDSHYEYATKVLQAGKHVVVEKAFTTSVAQGEALKALAQKQDKMISVYQNRRFDSDCRTVQRVIANKLLGDIVEAEFHYDRFKPLVGSKLHKEMPNPGAGLLMDLGPHLIDEALHIFGMPNALFADICITRFNSKVDDWFDMRLYYPSLSVRLKAGNIVREAIPANVIHGMKGSFIKTRGDVQESDLLAGKKPGNDNWGTELASEQGLLHTEIEGKVVRETILSDKGNYGDYYAEIYEAIVNGKPVPVTAEEGINTIRIIEAAIKSNKERREVAL